MKAMPVVRVYLEWLAIVDIRKLEANACHKI